MDRDTLSHVILVRPRLAAHNFVKSFGFFTTKSTADIQRITDEYSEFRNKFTKNETIVDFGGTRNLRHVLIAISFQ